MALELTDQNFYDHVGKDKYVLIEFYTKWCKFCRVLAPEYDKLVDNVKNNGRDDIVIARIEGGNNQISFMRYGVNAFPLIALFGPGTLRMKNYYRGMRECSMIERWVYDNCPKLSPEELKKKLNNGINLEPEKEKIKIKNITKENEEIIKEYFSLKKKIAALDEQLKLAIMNNEEYFANLNKKYVLEIDLSPENYGKGIIVIVLFVILYVAIHTFIRIMKSVKKQDLNKEQ